MQSQPLRCAIPKKQTPVKNSDLTSQEEITADGKVAKRSLFILFMLTVDLIMYLCQIANA